MSYKRAYKRWGYALWCLLLMQILISVNAQDFEPKNLRFSVPQTFSAGSLDSLTSNVKLVYDISVQDLLCAVTSNPQPIQLSNSQKSPFKVFEANQRSIELLVGIDCSDYSWPVYKNLASEAEHASLCYQPNLSSKRDVPCVKYALSVDFDEVQSTQFEVLQAFQNNYDIHLNVRAFSPSSSSGEVIENAPKTEYSFDALHWQNLDTESTLTIPGSAFQFQRFELQDVDYSPEDCPKEYEVCKRMEIAAQVFYRVMITGDEPEMTYSFSVFIPSNAIEHLEE